MMPNSSMHLASWYLRKPTLCPVHFPRVLWIWEKKKYIILLYYFMAHYTHIIVWVGLKMYGCEFWAGGRKLSVFHHAPPPPPPPPYRWHCTIVHRDLKQILGCCIFDAAWALPAHYGVVIQKNSPEGSPHHISLSKACYSYHDLRQRASLHQMLKKQNKRSTKTYETKVEVSTKCFSEIIHLS